MLDDVKVSDRRKSRIGFDGLAPLFIIVEVRFIIRLSAKIVTFHGVWKSQKKSYSTLRAKRATFPF